MSKSGSAALFGKPLFQCDKRRFGRRETEEVDCDPLLLADVVQVEKVVPAVIDIKYDRHRCSHPAIPGRSSIVLFRDTNRIC